MKIYTQIWVVTQLSGETCPVGHKARFPCMLYSSRYMSKTDTNADRNTFSNTVTNTNVNGDTIFVKLAHLSKKTDLHFHTNTEYTQLEIQMQIHKENRHKYDWWHNPGETRPVWHKARFPFCAFVPETTGANPGLHCWVKDLIAPIAQCTSFRVKTQTQTRNYTETKNRKLRLRHRIIQKQIQQVESLCPSPEGPSIEWKHKYEKRIWLGHCGFT